MSLFLNAWDSIRRNRKAPGSDPRLVRAIPGAVAQSPLERRVQEILAEQPTSPWDRLVAKVADSLRGFEDPGVLASLDEAVWGAWVWPALAQKELQGLEGLLLEIGAPSPSAADTSVAAPWQQPAAPKTA